MEDIILGIIIRGIILNKANKIPINLLRIVSLIKTGHLNLLIY